MVGSLAASGVLLAGFLLAERLQSEPMLDLSLLRVPTFDGGLAAGWAISASIFSLVTYLAIYMQNILGLSAVATGVRFLPMTVAIFVTAGIAGRLTSRVPRRLLIAPGFVLVGAELFLLMRGLTPSSGWTHLLAGMIVGGIGAGLVNTPLISTAVGVVEPTRAGMASGINLTLRQVGVATGIAALGTILASQIRSSVLSGLGGTALAGHAHALAHAISTGGVSPAIATTPAPLRGTLAFSARSAFTDGLNTILLIGAIVALVAAVASFVLIRERDFVVTDDGSGGMTAHRVVVVGGGFGGLQAVRGLRRAPVEVTLVDRQNYSLFQPLVYQVATGALSPAQIASPLRAVLKRQANARVVLAEVTGFDLHRQEVVLAHLPSGRRRAALGYDTLIVAGGSQLFLLRPRGMAGPRTAAQVAVGRARHPRSRPRRLRGSRGRERPRAAAGMAHVRRRGGRPDRSRDGRADRRARPRHASARLPRCRHACRARPARRARRSRPDELSGVALAQGGQGARAARSHDARGPHGRRHIGADSVAIRGQDGAVEHVAARTAIWAAGVTASDLAARLAAGAGLDVDRAGRLTVRPDLSLSGHPEVMALGDMVRVQAVDGSIMPLPGLAPVAIQQGRYAAHAIRDRLRGPRRMRRSATSTRATSRRSGARRPSPR